MIRAVGNRVETAPAYVRGREGFVVMTERKDGRTYLEAMKRKKCGIGQRSGGPRRA